MHSTKPQYALCTRKDTTGQVDSEGIAGPYMHLMMYAVELVFSKKTTIKTGLLSEKALILNVKAKKLLLLFQFTFPQNMF